MSRPMRAEDPNRETAQRASLASVLAALLVVATATPAAAELEADYAGVTEVAVAGFRKMLAGGSLEPGKVYFASKGSKFRVQQCAGGRCTVRFPSWIGSMDRRELAKKDCEEWVKQGGAGPAVAATPTCHHVEKDTNYQIAEDLLAPYDYRDASGFVVGPLVVPFKYQMKDWTLTGGGTVGVGFGFRWVLSEYFNLGPVATLGLSVVTVGKPTPPDANAGIQDAEPVKTETEVGLGAAGGLVLGFKDFQAGVLIGVDAAIEGYEYSDHPWLAFALGHNFF